jgi:hypothetical protein
MVDAQKRFSEVMKDCDLNGLNDKRLDVQPYVENENLKSALRNIVTKKYKRRGVAVFHAPASFGKSTHTRLILRDMLTKTGEVRGVFVVSCDDEVVMGKENTMEALKEGFKIKKDEQVDYLYPKDGSITDLIPKKGEHEGPVVIVLDQIESLLQKNDGKGPKDFEVIMSSLATKSFELVDKAYFFLVLCREKTDAMRLLKYNGGYKFYPVVEGTSMIGGWQHPHTPSWELDGIMWTEGQVALYVFQYLYHVRNPPLDFEYVEDENSRNSRPLLPTDIWTRLCRALARGSRIQCWDETIEQFLEEYDVERGGIKIPSVYDMKSQLETKKKQMFKLQSQIEYIQSGEAVKDKSVQDKLHEDLKSAYVEWVKTLKNFSDCSDIKYTATKVRHKPIEQMEKVLVSVEAQAEKDYEDWIAASTFKLDSFTFKSPDD